VKLILTGSISLSAMLVAVIGVLLSQWRWLRDAPSGLRKWFKVLTWYIIATHVVSATTALSSFISVMQGEAYINEAYFFIQVLFVISLVAISLGVVLVAYFILKV